MFSSVWLHGTGRSNRIIHGRKAWAQVLERGYEGLVGKDEASPYVEGRTLSWLKVKVPKYREGERGWDPKRYCLV
jgi:ATP-dependent DNA ligase